jgi:hypothetical protein
MGSGRDSYRCEIDDDVLWLGTGSLLPLMGSDESDTALKLMRAILDAVTQQRADAEEQEKRQIGFTPPPTKKKRGSPRKQKTTRNPPRKKK